MAGGAGGGVGVQKAAPRRGLQDGGSGVHKAGPKRGPEGGGSVAEEHVADPALNSRFWHNRFWPLEFILMHPRPLHDDDYAVLVRLLRDIRREVGVTQVELAKRLKVDQSLVSKVERQERRIDVSELRLVCIALGVPLADFVSRFEAALIARTQEPIDAADAT